MEIVESIAWISLGFLPMLGFMELAWRLKRKIRFEKTAIEKVPLDVVLRK